MHINNKPFDIELDIYREWCKFLRENVKPHLMLCGHFHTTRVVRPGHAWDNLGEPCTVVIGSRPGKTMDEYTGTAIELTEKNATIRFVHNIWMRVSESPKARAFAKSSGFFSKSYIIR